MGLNVDLLRSSFEVVAPKADELAETFYATLFVRHLEVVPLFEDVDMPKQRQMIVQALAFVVKNLENPEVLKEKLGELGARHVDYGAEAGHYPVVGECLLAALEHTAGEAWTGEMSEAWSEAYGAVTELMLAGAARAQEETPTWP